MVWDTDRIAVPLEDVGDANGSHGNLLLVRNALVQQMHQLILPGMEPRGAMVTDMMIVGQPLRIVNAHLGLFAGADRQDHAIAGASDPADGRSE